VRGAWPARLISLLYIQWYLYDEFVNLNFRRQMLMEMVVLIKKSSSMSLIHCLGFRERYQNATEDLAT
jgi:hypothetical protein